MFASNSKKVTKYERHLKKFGIYYLPLCHLSVFSTEADYITFHQKSDILSLLIEPITFTNWDEWMFLQGGPVPWAPTGTETQPRLQVEFVHMIHR